MQRIVEILLITVCAASVTLAQTNKTVTGTSTNAPKITQPGILTDEEIAKLQTDWSDPKTGAKAQFQASFTAVVPAPGEVKKYKGKVPYRITCQVLDTKVVRGKPQTERLNGMCTLYLVDSEGKVAEKKTLNLDRMCPT